jgi:hypothetical protein
MGTAEAWPAVATDIMTERWKIYVETKRGRGISVRGH